MFAVGLAAGRYRTLPAALLQRPRFFVVPALVFLLLLLGYEVGSQPTIRTHLAAIGGGAVLIALLTMLGSALTAALTYRLFFKDGNLLQTHDGQEETDG